MIDRVVRKVFIGLALFGLAANIIGFAFLIVNTFAVLF